MYIEELSRYKEKPKIGTRICYVSANGEVDQCMWDDGDICNQLLDFGNCYPLEMKPTLILAVEGTKILRRLATGGDFHLAITDYQYAKTKEIYQNYSALSNFGWYYSMSFESRKLGEQAINEITLTRLDAICACGWPIA